MKALVVKPKILELTKLNSFTKQMFTIGETSIVFEAMFDHDMSKESKERLVEMVEEYLKIEEVREKIKKEITILSPEMHIKEVIESAVYCELSMRFILRGHWRVTDIGSKSGADIVATMYKVGDVGYEFLTLLQGEPVSAKEIIDG